MVLMVSVGNVGWVGASRKPTIPFWFNDERLKTVDDTNQVRPDLYRLGNRTGPRMNHVRQKEYDAIKDPVDSTYVLPGKGGISTFSTPPPEEKALRITWRYPSTTPEPKNIIVRNDHGNHYSWEPAARMTLVLYQQALLTTHRTFIRCDPKDQEPVYGE